MTAIQRVQPARAAAQAPWRAACIAASLAVADLALDPAQTHVPMCPFRAATGAQCPLCGSLRCAYALMHGDVMTALRDNLVLVLMTPVLVGLWIEWVVRTRRGLAARPVPRVAVAAIVAVAIVFTVVRNLPPMTALRP